MDDTGPDAEWRWGVAGEYTTSYDATGLPAQGTQEMVSRFPEGATPRLLIYLPVFSDDSFVMIGGAGADYPDQKGRPRHRLAPALELALKKIRADLDAGVERRIRIRAPNDYKGRRAVGWMVVDALGRLLRKEYEVIEQRRAA